MVDRALFDVSLDAPEMHPCIGGSVAIFTRCCPTKSGNEDAAAVLEIDENTAMFVVADGCGGMTAGAAASHLAIKSLLRAVRKDRREGDSIRGAILDGIEAANEAVRALGMGAATTLAVVELHDKKARTFHIGDSAVLLMGGRGKIKIQTRSHSPVGYGVEAGLIHQDEAIHHEDLHLVSNVLGDADTHIEVGPTRKLAARDTLLVASDGLTDNLHVTEIIELARKGPLQRAAERLADVASERMQSPTPGQPSKPDDLTFILFRPR